MTSPPRISIVTPSFNQADFLERSLRSVLDQEYPDLEYFVIDGGSTDGSADIIRKYAGRLTGWVSEPDQGQSDALIKGFTRCTGDVLAWINSSDMYEPGAFKEVANAYVQKRAAIYFGDVRLIDEEDEPLDWECTAHLDREAMVYEGTIPAQPGVFWTRQAYERCGGVDPSFYYCMDVDLFIRLARVGAMEYVPKLLGRLRQHHDAKTARVTDAWRREAQRILEANVPSGGLIQGRRFMSFAKRLGRFAAERRWHEVGKLLRRARAMWKTGGR